jgi:hypothetical protein
MRYPKLLLGKRVPEFLLVAALYSVIFSVGWFLAKVNFMPTQPDVSRAAGAIPSPPTAGAVEPANYNVGKLVVVGPGRCQYGEFSNVQARPFQITAADCDRVLQSLDPAAATAGHGADRIEEIGKYFRGDRP